MPSNYPTSLDDAISLKTARALNEVIPASDHNDLGTAIISLETKLGSGASTPTTAGQVLTVTGAGTTAFAALPAGTTTPDATTTVKGIVQLGGDLAGTAAAPTVPGLTSKVASNTAITPGTATKITYDAKGLVTAGTTLAAADVPTLNQNTTGNAATSSLTSALKSATTSINVAAATAPVAGYVLTATSPTAAAWTNPSTKTFFEAIIAPSGGDYTTIGAAVTAGKKSIYVRNGTYSEAEIAITIAGTSIVGESKDNVIINFTGTANGFNISVAGVTLRAMTLSGNTTLANAIVLTTAYYTWIDGCAVQNATMIGASGIKFGTNGWYPKVTNCLLADNDYASIFGNTASNQYSYIEGNSFRYTTAGNTAIRTLGHRARIFGNHFNSYNSGAIQANIYLDSAAGVYGWDIVDNIFDTSSNPIRIAGTASAWTITGNHFNACGGAGVNIQTEGTGSLNFSTISGNSSDDTGDGYSFLGNGLLDSTISGNTLRGRLYLAQTGKTGITITTGRNNTLTGNTITEFTNGITVGTGVVDTFLTNNQVKYHVTTPITDSGTATSFDTKSLVTSKGDIAFRGASVLGRLPVGLDGAVITADSSQPLGVRWGAAGGGLTSPLTTKGDVWGYGTGQARIPVGTDAQVLTADSTQPLGVKWATSAAGAAGQTTYSAIVAPSGGDYTTLGAALAAATPGANIFVKNGTYAESLITCAVEGITIVGQSWKDTIISMTTNNITFSGQNLFLGHLTIKTTTGVVALNGHYTEAHNVYFDKEAVSLGSATSHITTSGFNIKLIGCMIDTNNDNAGQTYAINFNGTQAYVSGCLFNIPVAYQDGYAGINTSSSDRWEGNLIKANGYGTANHALLRANNNAVITGNTFDITGGNYVCVLIGGGGNTVTSNAFLAAGSANSGKGVTFLTGFYNKVNDNYFNGMGVIGIDTTDAVGGASHTISGNTINSPGTGTGIKLTRDNCILTGNNIAGCTVGINNSSIKSIITSNMLLNSTTALLDTGTSTSVGNNITA